VGTGEIKPAVRIILPMWFDHLGERFSHKEVQLEMFCLAVKIGCTPAEKPRAKIPIVSAFK